MNILTKLINLYKAAFIMLKPISLLAKLIIVMITRGDVNERGVGGYKIRIPSTSSGFNIDGTRLELITISSVNSIDLTVFLKEAEINMIAEYCNRYRKLKPSVNSSGIIDTYCLYYIEKVIGRLSERILHGHNKRRSTSFFIDIFSHFEIIIFVLVLWFALTSCVASVSYHMYSLMAEPIVDNSVIYFIPNEKIEECDGKYDIDLSTHRYLVLNCKEKQTDARKNL